MWSLVVEAVAVVLMSLLLSLLLAVWDGVEWASVGGGWGWR